MSSLHDIVKVSLNRQIVDTTLSQRNTSLAAFIDERLSEGKSMEDIWLDLRNTTGVPFSVRTLYRWAADIERANS